MSYGDRKYLIFVLMMTFLSFFFLTCPPRGGWGIRTSYLHFMRRGPQPIELPFGDDLFILYRGKLSFVVTIGVFESVYVHVKVGFCNDSPPNNTILFVFGFSEPAFSRGHSSWYYTQRTTFNYRVQIGSWSSRL
jgi:hypothetical protein